MKKIACDLCDDDLEVTATSGDQYLDVILGTGLDLPKVVKQVCRDCITAIDISRGRRN